jgi:hypothetical protein
VEAPGSKSHHVDIPYDIVRHGLVFSKRLELVTVIPFGGYNFLAEECQCILFGYAVFGHE